MISLVTCNADLALGQALLGAEIHALSSGTKPVSGWLARDGIQESREACGGHGYLSGTSSSPHGGMWRADSVVLPFVGAIFMI